LYTLFFRKYWLDELYENVIVGKVLLGGFFAGLQLFDSKGVDGVVNGLGSVPVVVGRAIRRVQTGQLQLYGVVIGIGLVVIMLCVYFLG
jgi:NADH-quinone oxidoreductase subunit L